MPRRTLATIMFADIAGYSALIQNDEARAIEMRERHRTLMDALHANYDGKIVQYYGDGTLSIFDSAVNAVDCAVAIQRSCREEKRIPLRVGIHLGDIVVDDANIYGDGVNVASRVETLGVPGAVLITDQVQNAIRNHTHLETTSLGFFEFKNIRNAVEIYALANSGIHLPNRTELGGKLKEQRKSVAVLPFANMSSDPENEFFSDGTSEEILNALVKVKGLKVTARTSSFAYKGQQMDIREIGRQLDVKYILEGSVRRASNRVRITAQLINAADGFHLFSEVYDRTLDDIFAVQDEIATTITHLLRQHLESRDQQQPMIAAPTTNMEAYQLYLQGLYYANQFGHDAAMSKAIPLLEQAIEKAPDFGQAYGKLAFCYFFQAFNGKLSWEEAQRQVAHCIQKVAELQIESPDIYFIRGAYEHFNQWNWKNALEVTLEGLEKFPNHAPLYHLLATLQWTKGNLDAILTLMNKGLELDPLSIEMNLYTGIAYIWAGAFDRAEKLIDKVLEMVPEHRASREYKGWIAAFTGQFDEAIEIFDSLPSAGYRLHRSTCLAWVYWKIDRRDEALQLLGEVEQLAETNINYSMDLAVLFTCFGNFDQAFLHLEKSIRNRISDSMMIRSDIYLRPLKEDPRWRTMLKLIGDVPEFEYQNL